VSLLEYLY